MVEKEQKFCTVIIPMKDMDEFFDENPDDLKKIQIVESHYQGFRSVRGKKPINHYIIVNQDEPYAEEVWKIILNGEEKKSLAQKQEGGRASSQD